MRGNGQGGSPRDDRYESLIDALRDAGNGLFLAMRSLDRAAENSGHADVAAAAFKARKAYEATQLEIARWTT